MVFDLLTGLIEDAGQEVTVDRLVVTVQALCEVTPPPVDMKPLYATLRVFEAVESPEFLRGFAAMAAIAMITRGDEAVIANGLTAAAQALTQAKVDGVTGQQLKPFI